MKDSDDLRAHLGSLFAPVDAPEYDGDDYTDASFDSDFLDDSGGEFVSAATPDEEEEERLEEWLDSSAPDEEHGDETGFEFVEVTDETTERDVWVAFDDVDTAGAAPSLFVVDECVEETRRSASFVRRAMAGFVAVVFVAVSAVAIIFGNHTAVRVEPTYADVPDVPQELSCFGPFHRSVDVSVNVTNEDEKISSGAYVVADGRVDYQGRRIVNSDEWSFVSSRELSGVLRGVEPHTMLAGANVHRARSGDMRGSATSSCVAPAMEHYLVGSQTDIGSANELVVYNPNSVPTAVTLEAFGGQGVLDVGTLKQFSVAPKTLRRVVLDGLVDSDSRLALHVAATSAPVAVVLQETVLDGATPAGVSYVVPSQFGNHAVVSGVGFDGEKYNVPVLRVANMNNEVATFSVRAVGRDNVLDMESLRGITVEPGTVLDVSLDELDPGATYTLLVDSDMRVGVGVENMRSRGSGTPRDIAWVSAGDSWRQASASFGAASAALSLFSEETADVTVLPVGGAGAMDAVRVRVPAGRSVVVDMPQDARAVVVSSPVNVYGAVNVEVVLDDGIAVDWLALTPSFTDSAAERVGIF